jgi:PIN domain nuclease of toxin-antitoxin system
MIIDTTYLLPLARIHVEKDLLRAIAEGRIKIKLDFSDLKVNLISIFELQAKASKLGIPPKYVFRAIDTIFKVFEVIPYYKREIIEAAHKLREQMSDYIDCIIVATAITRKEPLVTEDKVIIGMKERIKRQYGIDVYTYNDIVKQMTQLGKNTSKNQSS